MVLHLLILQAAFGLFFGKTRATGDYCWKIGTCKYGSTCSYYYRWVPAGYVYSCKPCVGMHRTTTCGEKIFEGTELVRSCRYHIDIRQTYTLHEAENACRDFSSTLAMFKNEKQQRSMESVLKKYFGTDDFDINLWIGVEERNPWEDYWRYLDGSLIPVKVYNDYPEWLAYVTPSLDSPLGQRVILKRRNIDSNRLFRWSQTTGAINAGFVCEKLASGLSCYSSPCQNGGTCFNRGCSYKCRCPLNFYPPNCEAEKSCESHNPCKNRGRCFRRGRNLTCDCFQGFSGAHCERPNFYTNTHSGRCSYHFRMKGFLSTYDGAVAACSEIGSHIAIIRNHTQQKSIEGIAARLYRRYDYRLWIGSQRQDGWILPDGTSLGKKNSFSYPRWQAGNPSSASDHKHIMLSSGQRPLYSVTGFYHVHLFWATRPLDIVGGYICEKLKAGGSVCDGSPCKNGGVCNDLGCDFTCTCPSYSTGPTCAECTTEDPCHDLYCHNGGTCLRESCAGSRQAKCACPTGFLGLRCDVCFSIKICLPFCKNGGTCILSTPGCPGKYSCRCPLNFDGPACENCNLTPCRSSRCLNGATCVPSPSCVDDYTCQCADGFSGYSCENCYYSPCSSSPCKNGGTCVPGEGCSNIFTCECTIDYSGALCETCVYDPCGNVTCLNGGKCVRLGCSSDFNCSLCPTYFTGMYCDQEVFLLGNEKCSYHLHYLGQFEDVLITSNYSYAKEGCERLGATLAQIKSYDEQELINNLTVNEFEDEEVYLWVGGEYLNRLWVWLDGTKIPLKNKVGYPRWGRGNPSSSTKNPKLLLSNLWELSGTSSNENHILFWANFYNEFEAGYICEKHAYGSECDSSPCVHGSTCVTVGCSYRCVCAGRYVGRNCEFLPPKFYSASPSSGSVFGNTFRLSCSAEGIPTPRIFWKIMNKFTYPNTSNNLQDNKDLRFSIANTIDLPSKTSNSILTLIDMGVCLERTIISCWTSKPSEESEMFLRNFSINPVSYVTSDDTYFVFPRNETRSADAAFTFCLKNFGGNLASIKDVAAQRLLKKAINKLLNEGVWIKTNTWIGLRKTNITTYEWPENKSPLFTNWDMKEPHYNCTYISGRGMWKTQNCSGNFTANMICQIPGLSPPKIIDVNSPYGEQNSSIIVRWRTSPRMESISHRIEARGQSSYRMVDVVPAEEKAQNGSYVVTLTGLKPKVTHQVKVTLAPLLCSMNVSDARSILTAPPNSVEMSLTEEGFCLLSWQWPSAKFFNVEDFIVNVTKYPYAYTSGMEEDVVNKIFKESFQVVLDRNIRRYQFPALPNRNHFIYVTGRSSTKRSTHSQASGGCHGPLRGPPASPDPEVTVGIQSVLASFHPLDETEAPVSCYFLVAVYHQYYVDYQMPEINEKFLDQRTSVYAFKLTSDAEYVAMAVPSGRTNLIEIYLGDSRNTSCDVLDIWETASPNRNKRDVRGSKVYLGKNLPLITESYYTFYTMATTIGASTELKVLASKPVTVYVSFSGSLAIYASVSSIGSLLFLFMAALFLAATRRKYKAWRRETRKLSSTDVPDVKFDALKENLQGEEILMEDINKTKLIKRKGSCEMWKAEIVTGKYAGLLAFLKIATGSKMTARQRQDFDIEVELVHLIGPHSFIVHCLGLCSYRDKIITVFEYIPNGTLHKYLIENKPEHTTDGLYAKLENDFGPLLMAKFSFQIAKGMERLSQLGIVHRSLNSRKVLLTNNMRCKISDFSKARRVKEQDGLYQYPDIQINDFQSRWTAPEAYFEFVFSDASDVWSFGVVMWEIFNFGNTPYKELHGNELEQKIYKHNYRLRPPQFCPMELYNLMHSCWHVVPVFRPSFQALSSQIGEYMSKEEQYAHTYEEVNIYDNEYEDLDVLEEQETAPLQENMDTLQRSLSSDIRSSRLLSTPTFEDDGLYYSESKERLDPEDLQED